METTTPSTSSSQSDMTGLSMGTPTPSTPGSRNDSQMMPSQRSGSSLSATSSDSSTNTVVQAVAANGSFRTLTAALKAADLTDVLSQEGPFTIFAPTDAAFAALPPGTLAKLLKPENKAMLIKVLTYHVVSGRVSSNQLTSGAVNTVEGKSVEIQVSDGGVQVNDARVIQPDVNASNGVIHAINKVILPPDM
ncbi:MAG: fasciclin domain-containing protein [Scytolyngbya sp. HA4215-MV1]|nr:fasciclin domain-containing protein [Scytolyngbya sp. HA4215-MV1]